MTKERAIMRTVCVVQLIYCHTLHRASYILKTVKQIV